MNAPFLTPDLNTQNDYLDAILTAGKAVCEHYAPLTHAYQGKAPKALREAILSTDICPEHGKPLNELLNWAGETILQHSIALGSTRTMAHLHCAPLIPALAAEVLISASNASMDSWDQAPAATTLEQHLLTWLAKEIGWANDSGGGVLTSGGTQSNFMGLLLARDAWCHRAFGVRVQETGLPEAAKRGRIFCSNAAHFSVQQTAALLGLGQNSVIAVKTDDAQRISLPDLQREIDQARAQNLIPFALVATAGTTDYGSIDPLPQLAQIAQTQALWLHVDAAYAGALLLSATLRERLNGLALADSITLDFHKLFYQPISASAFMLRNPSHWEYLRLHADYLNPPEHEALGMDDLVTRSIQTTRRFDALKIVLSLQHLGRSGFAALIEKTLENAQLAANILQDYPHLRLATPPTLNSVLFRIEHPNLSDDALNTLNHRVRQTMMLSGKALLGQTRFQGNIFMKMTLLNPAISADDFHAIFKDIETLATELTAKDSP